VPDERVLVLSRAGYTGIQRWAGVWTGDNSSSWEHLEMSLPQLCNLGLSGIPFVGADIGGFFADCTPELLVRWMQLGACYPLARNNCARDFRRQEPWVHGESVEAACRAALEWRYAHLPYLYTQFDTAARTGVPILRPLFFAAPDDPQCGTLADEALLGPDLLIAPVLRPGKTAREVYLPAGGWVDTRTGEHLRGPASILADAPLEGPMPVYARGGSIVPTGPPLQWSDQVPLDPLTLKVYPDETGRATGTLYEDDGVSYRFEGGDWCRTRFTCVGTDGGEWRIDATRTGDFVPPPRTVVARIHSRGSGHPEVVELSGPDAGDGR
jgi:alpha-glucosidase